MIIRDGKFTTWNDTLENLLQAAREAAFGQLPEGGSEFYSQDHDAAITVPFLGQAYTEDARLFQMALQDGWWIEEEMEEGWTIFFNWPKDPAKSPNEYAIHITRTVIPLSEAERRWGKTNLRQNAYGRLTMWKAGPRAWFTTEYAMTGLFGPEPKAATD